MEKVKTEIFRVAGNKKVIKVTADKDNWWHLDPKVKEFLESGNSNVVAGVTAEIEYEKNDDKVTVKRITVDKQAPKSEESKPKEAKKEYKSGYSGGNDRNRSIERQCALKSAVELLSGDNAVDINSLDVVRDEVLKTAKMFADFIAEQE